MASLTKEQLASLVYQPKYRFLGSVDNIDIVEEIENPRTYISSCIIRAHPQTVFEEFLLQGTVPSADTLTTRYSNLMDAEILERGHDRDVIRMVFKGQLLAAPREVVWCHASASSHCINSSLFRLACCLLLIALCCKAVFSASAQVA